MPLQEARPSLPSVMPPTSRYWLALYHYEVTSGLGSQRPL